MSYINFFLAATFSLSSPFLLSRERKAYKNVTHFYSSADKSAELIEEPVEWPVKLAYGMYGLRTLGKLCTHFFGKHLTKQQAAIKHSTDPVLTKKQIEHYLRFYGPFISMDLFITPEQGFRSFNDWFTRALKNPEKDRPLEKNRKAIASPADSKLLIIPDLSADTEVTIKEVHFNLETFLQDKELAAQYTEGTMMIFRLAPYDYHRYHYPITCTVSPEIYIDGKYHSVNPRAFTAGAQPLTKNKRSYEILTPAREIQRSANNPIIMVQVGATAVASIVNHFGNYPTTTVFKKGSEAGYFQFGGSTIVLLFKKGTIIPNQEIVNRSCAGYETAVKVRSTIAHWK